MKTWLLIATAPLIATTAALGIATATPGPVGEWQIADGTANVAIRPCGGDLCGFVSWAKDRGTAVGKQVLINMKPAGHLWFGTAVNVVDGQQYSARMSMESASTLKVEGCVIGGMICGGQQWSRIK